MRTDDWLYWRPDSVVVSSCRRFFEKHAEFAMHRLPNTNVWRMERCIAAKTAVANPNSSTLLSGSLAENWQKKRIAPSPSRPWWVACCWSKNGKKKHFWWYMWYMWCTYSMSFWTNAMWCTLCNHLDKYDNPHYIRIFDVKSSPSVEFEQGHCSVQRLPIQ